jgi:hypothetical protein
MSTKKKLYYVDVSYSCSKYAWGSLDQQIEKLIGYKQVSGAGTGFGWRDVSGFWKRKDARDRAVVRIKKAFGRKRGIRIRKSEMEDY